MEMDLQEGGSTLALVRQNIVEALYSMLDWKMEWNGGMDCGMDYGFYIFHSNTQLYYVAMCLLTYS